MAHQLGADALSRGKSVSTLSAQWASRPPDQRFLSIETLMAATTRLRSTSSETMIETADIRVHVDKTAEDSKAGLTLTLPTGNRVLPSHWSFGQLCSLVQTPAYYLRKLPAELAGINLQYALQNTRTDPVKAYMGGTDGATLRALTGPDYGRIYDCDVVGSVKRLVEASDVEWKVPGTLNWSTMQYDPNTPVTPDTTTLYASDRDVFMFLCADRNPIEIGKLPDGTPDVVFRGFYVSNSEVGSRTFSLATMYFRAVCCNRILWGVENFHEVSFKHTRKAPERFLREIQPVLRSYAHGSTSTLVEGVRKAKAALVAHTDEERERFLRERNFTKADTSAIIASVLADEGHPATSIWDFCQGITRVAQGRPNADTRFDMEREAGKLLAQVK